MHLLASEGGTTEILVEDDMTRVVTYVDSLKYVEGKVAKYCWGELRTADNKTKFNPHQVAQAARQWELTTYPLREPPKMVRYHSDEGLCFHRLNFDPRPMATPIFDEILSRCSEPAALMAFIGSIMDDNSDTEQYLWMYGAGLNGKGSIIDFLKRLMGPAYASEEPENIMDKNQRFWTWGLRGKRLIAFAECAKDSVVSCPRFKSLTGGDAIRVEAKRGAITSETMKLKIIIGSNEPPNISSIKADTRRAIFITFGDVPPGTTRDPRYRDKLWAEAPGIVFNCTNTYKKMCPDGGEIPCDQEAVRKLAMRNEEKWEDILDACFTIDHDRTGGCDAWKFADSLKKIAGCHANWEIRKFKDWLERTHGIQRTTNHPRMYPGLHEREGGENLV